MKKNLISLKVQFDDLAKIENLESWRGLLSWIVVIAHVNQIYIQSYYKVNTFFSEITGFFANVSVALFFLISGMSIAFSVKTNSKDRFYFMKYLSSRITRIYLPLIVVLILSSVLYLILHAAGMSIIPSELVNGFTPREHFQISWSDILNQIFFWGQGILQVNGPLWSLSIEWWLYVSAMFLVLIKDARWLLKPILFLAFLICLRRAGIFSKPNVILPAFSFGVIWFIGFFYLMIVNKNFGLIFSVVGCILIAIVLFFFGFEISSITGDSYHCHAFRIGYTLLLLPIIPKINLGNFFKSLGEFSYSTYIIHFPILLFGYFLIGRKINSIYVLVLAIAVSVTIVIIIGLAMRITVENKIYLKKINQYIYQNILLPIENIFYKKGYSHTSI